MFFMIVDWDIKEEEFEILGVMDCKSFCLFLWSLEFRSDVKGMVFFIGKGNVEERLVIFFFLNVILFIKLFILVVWGVSSLYGMVIVFIYILRIVFVWYERVGCGENKIRKNYVW